MDRIMAISGSFNILEGRHLNIGGYTLALAPTVCACDCGVDLAWVLVTGSNAKVMLGCVNCRDPLATIKDIRNQLAPII